LDTPRGSLTTDELWMRNDRQPTIVGVSRHLLRDVLLGFMRVHVLHHASHAPFFGVEITEELRRHGYAIGPGTLYPMLHALEETGVLRSTQTLVNGKNRKYYRTTTLGDALLAELRVKLRELLNEVLDTPPASKRAKSKGA